MSYDFDNVYSNFIKNREKLFEVKSRIEYYSKQGFDTSSIDKEQVELEEKVIKILNTFSREDLQKAVLLSYGIEI